MGEHTGNEPRLSVAPLTVNQHLVRSSVENFRAIVKESQ